jgi:predicted GNAT family acetyltransferase
LVISDDGFHPVAAGPETIEGGSMNGQAKEEPRPSVQTYRADSGSWQIPEADTAALVAEVAGRRVDELEIPSAETDIEIAIRRRTDEDRFVAVLGEWRIGEISYREIGFIHYRPGDDVLEIDWTYLEPEFRGHGIAVDFIADVLDDLRDTGSRISVTCPVVSAFIDANPQFADLLL